MQYSIDASVAEHLHSLTLLCVEDNKTTQLIYGSIFEDLFKEILFADNGEEGYEIFKNQKVDLIIADYDMPRLNGIEMIKKIRTVDKEIPVILVSAINDIDIMIEALRINVNNFLKKPIITQEVLQTIENVSKLLIANNYLKEQREKKIKEFEKKEKYNSYQEDLAFSKELNILRNDFYYQMHENSQTTLIDFFYKPLDVLSGDAYSAREITPDIHLFFIIDGMGKGLSASLSSMLLTTYVNHVVDKEKKSFRLKAIIDSALEYIKPILLDEEAISADFIVINYKHATLEYAKFAMPPSLALRKEGEIVKIRSNNPPLSKYTDDFSISTIDISTTVRFLFYSDGIVESRVRNKKELYADYLENDFVSSFTKDELRENILWKIDTPEDDMTFIFINKLTTNKKSATKAKTFQSTIESVDEANEWYTKIWSEITKDLKLAYNAGVVFSELFMNAFEHGNLGIDAATKNRLLDEDSYFITLENLQKKCSKKIEVEVEIHNDGENRYISTRISDEGDGFDTNILSDIFRNRKNFNGRGVYISRQSSLGIYYNSKGNSVLFLHKIENEA